jgi:hypothetical protein
MGRFQPESFLGLSLVTMVFTAKGYFWKPWEYDLAREVAE